MSALGVLTPQILHTLEIHLGLFSADHNRGRRSLPKMLRTNIRAYFKIWLKIRRVRAYITLVLAGISSRNSNRRRAARQA